MSRQACLLLCGPLLHCWLVSCDPPVPAAPRSVATPGYSAALEPTAASTATTSSAAAGVDLDALDPGVSACADLYLHACGGWLTQAVVPSGRQWIDLSGEQISERRRAITYELLAGPSDAPAERATGLTAAAPGSKQAARLTAAPRRLFQACMDEDAIERAGLQPLAALLKQIDDISDATSLAQVVATLHQRGVDALFRLRPSLDQTTPPTWSWRLSPAQTITAVRSRSEPPSPNEAAKQAAARFERLVAATLERIDAGSKAQPKRQIKQQASGVVAIELDLDRAVLNGRAQINASLRARQSQQVKGLSPLGARFDWPAYLQARGLGPKLSPTTPSKDWLRGVALALDTASLPMLKAHLKWRLARSLSLALPRGMREPISNTSPDAGETFAKPRRDQCMNLVEHAFSAELSQAFMAAALSPPALILAESLSRASVASFDSLLKASSHLHAAERAKLRERLTRVDFQLGAGRAEAPLSLPQTGDFAALLLATQRAVSERDVKRTSSPPDRQLMPVPASTPNMFYHPWLNVVVAPAGYLLPPNFDLTASQAANMARAGFGFAHELAHAFDAEWLSLNASCSDADLSSSARATGLPATATDADRFHAVLIKRAQRETLADMVGLRVAYQAYVTAPSVTQPSAAASEAGVEGQAAAGSTKISANQLFWLNYAQSQCRKATAEGEAWLRDQDSHLPNHARVNYSARSVAQFAEDFGCEPPDAMAQPSSCGW